MKSSPFLPSVSRNLARLALAVTLLYATGSSHGQMIDIRPAPNIDERLFLVRTLELMYEEWPSVSDDPQTFNAATAEARASAIRLREHCRREKLGPELEAAFSEFVATLDAQTDFLVSIGRVRAEAGAQARQDQLAAGGAGVSAGAGAYGLMQQADSTTGEAAAAALVVGGIQYLFNSWDKAQQRNEAERQAVAAAAQRLQDRITTSLSNAQATARQLARRHGWGKSEPGFELDEKLAEYVQQIASAGDTAALLRVYDEAVARRPRDFYPRVFRAVHRAIADEGKPDAILRHARDCLDSASLIPVGDVYNELREAAITVSAMLASAARTAEITQGNRPAGSTPASQLAVHSYRWLIENGPRDSTGKVGEGLAFALLDDGQLEAAVTQANTVLELRRTEAAFSYNYARLLSRRGNTELAVAWLGQAIEQGFGDVVHARRDPCLANLRRDQAAKFNDLVKVQWQWNIVFGFVNDDIVVTNTSKFPLTNVVLSARLEQDDRVWTPELKIEYLAPGATHKWENVVSVPGSRLSKSVATLTSDQNR